MDEFLGFPRLERLKPSRTTPKYKRLFLVPFEPAKGTGAPTQEARKVQQY